MLLHSNKTQKELRKKRFIFREFYSVPHPFIGDYVRLRQNIQWKKLCMSLNDQYIVFADIVNKITRSSGKVKIFNYFSHSIFWLSNYFLIHPKLKKKVTPILMALSTNAMLLLDQKTLQIKYRIPATEIYRLSLSPYHDNIAVFHLRDVRRQLFLYSVFG